MSEKDELESQEPIQFDYGGAVAGSGEVAVPPGFAREDVFSLERPIEYGKEERDIAATAAFNSVYEMISEDNPEADVFEKQQRTYAALSGREYKEGQIYADETKVVGDPLDSNLIFAPSVGVLASRAGDSGTIPAYKLQEEASMKALEGKGFFETVGEILFADPSPETMMTLQQAQEQRLVDAEGELIRPPSVTEREYIPDNEALRDIATFTGFAGAGVGAFGGAATGGAGGLIAGGLLGGMVGSGLGNMAAIGVAGLASLPEDYSTIDGVQDLVKRTYTLMGLGDDLAGFLATTSPEARDLIVTNVVAMAEGLGIERSAEWIRENEINELSDITKKGSESIRAIEKKLAEEAPEEDDEDESLISPTGPFMTTNPTLGMLLKLGEGRMRGAISDIGDDFILGLHEIIDEVGRSEEYKSMRSQVRKEFMEQRKVEYDLLSRKQKPTDDDWIGLNLFNNVTDGIATEEEIKPQVTGWVDNLSFNRLHPSIQGEMPNVEVFKELALTIPDNHAMFTKDIPPNVAASIMAVHDGRSDTEIQNLINTLPIGFLRNSPGFDLVVQNSLPDFDKVKEWASDTNKFLDDKTGARVTRIFEREAFDITMEAVPAASLAKTPVGTSNTGTLYKRTTNAEMMNWAALIITAANEAEIDLMPDVLKPLLQVFGLPNDLYVPTSAGLDRQFKRGIRHPDASWAVRVDARQKSGLGGPHLGHQEIARSFGFSPDSWQYNLLSAAGFIKENLGQPEKAFFGFSRRLGRLGVNAASPYTYKGFIAADAGQRYKLIKDNLLAGVVEDSSIDPLAARHKLIQDILIMQMNKGLNPLQDYDPKTGVGISTAQKQILTDMMEVAGIEPEIVFAAFRDAAGDTIKITAATEELVRKLGNNEVMVFRSSESYGRIRSQLNEMVNEGLISPNDADIFLAQIEAQAFKAADSPNTRFYNATEVIDGLEIRLDRGIDDAEVRMFLDPIDSATTREGRLRSAFTYDQETGKRIIRLFSTGDMRDLWGANADFMNSLMGPEYSQKLIAMFDHEVDANGVRRLTDSGAEQILDAWQYYRRMKDLPNGYVARLFDELWVNMHNFWSRLRKRQGLLPKQVRQFWDAEFGELPKDRRFVEGLVDAARRKKNEPIKVAGTELERAEQARPKKVGMERVARQVGMDPDTLRAFLGQKTLTRVEIQTDPDTGAQVRIPRRVYADFNYDPLDVGRKLLALIELQPYKKKLAERNTATIGTGKYAIPAVRLGPVLEAAKRRMTDALGHLPNELEERIYQRDFQRSEEGFTQINDLPDVTDADIAAFTERLAMQLELPVSDDFARILQEIARSTEFIVLNARERAGFKTLVQELARNPAGDPIPTALLDPNANLRIISVAEYNRVLQVAQDAEAGPLNRVDRNSIHPGYVQSIVNFFGRKGALAPVGLIFGKFAKALKKDLPRLNKKNADPALVDLYEQWLRRLAAVPEEIAKAAESGKDADFYDFYKRMTESFAPRVAFHNLRFLFEFVDKLEGTKKDLDADAALAIRDAELAGDPPPLRFGSFEALDIGYIYVRLDRIQEVLDGFYGMNRTERAALMNLRELYERKSGLTEPMSEADATIAADALQILHTGLAEKKAYVTKFARQTLRRAVGYTEPELPFVLEDKTIRALYISMYTGNIVKIKEIATNHSFDGIWQARFAYLLGKKGSDLVQQYGDLESMMTNILIYMKLDEVRFGLARDLAELGYNKSVRELIGNQKAEGVPGLDRQKFLDRVAQYIHDELGFQEKNVVGGGELLKGERIAGAEEFGVLDNPHRTDLDGDVISPLDRDAKAEAARIIDRMGLRRELGLFARVLIGDETFLLPEAMIEGLTNAINATYKVPSAEQVLFQRNFGRTGTVEYRLNPDNILPIETQKFRDILQLAHRAAELIVSPRVFYRRLLIGVGGLPMVPYMSSLFIGGLSEIHLGQGAKAFVNNLIGAAKTPAMLAASALSGSQVDFVTGVLARLYGRGSFKPPTRPHITPDGRIFTADMVANGVDAYGFKTAFAEMTESSDVHKRILLQFTQANPALTSAQIGGTIGTMLATLAGPKAAAAGGLAGAGAGLTLGYLLTEGNVLDRNHRFYREAAISIDTYQRLKVFMKEIDSGLDIPAASRRTLDIKLDYGDLSDLEGKYFRQAFAFWAYFSQASKLFAQSIIENPDRVIAQLKLARSSQMAVTKGEDPDLVLAPWDRTRMFIPFLINGQAVRLPYTSVADTLQLFIDLLGSTGIGFGPQETRTSQMAVVNRLNPFLVEALRQFYLMDPGRGYDLERATKQVPAILIQLDHDIFGGVLHDLLDIRHIAADDLKQGWGEKDGIRFNPNNLEMPGRGIYVAGNTKNYSLLMNTLQTVATGRMGRLLEALDRSNLGVTEAMVKAADMYYQADKERPLLARIPYATEVGLVKAKRSPRLQRPTDYGIEVLDTATGRRSMREYGRYIEPDGTSYILPVDDFHPLELLKIFSLSPVPISSFERPADRALRKNTKELKEKAESPEL